MAKSLKDNLAAIRVHISQAQAPQPQNVADQTRDQVSNVTDACRAKLKILQDVVKTDANQLDLENDFHIIAMVSKLLKTSAKPNDKVVAAMGFDKGNLLKLMQAMFSVGQGGQGQIVSPKKVRSSLKPGGRPFIEVVYRDMLGLGESSTEEQIEEKIKAFSGQLEPLADLFEYEFAGDVAGMLEACGKIQDPRKKVDFVRENGFEGIGKVFDEGPAETILQNLERSSDNKPKIDLEADFQAYSQDGKNQNTLFYQLMQAEETKLVVAQLCNLHLALRRSDTAYEAKHQSLHFGEKKRSVVLTDLDKAFGMPLREAMEKAAKSFETTEAQKVDPTQHYALIQTIANYYGLSENAELKAKLAEIGGTLKGLFPELELVAQKK